MAVLERITNVAVTVAALLVCAVLIKQNFASPGEASGSRGGKRPDLALLVGKQLPLVGLPSAKVGERRVILALSTRCHFCEQSLPFYRELQALQFADRRFQLIGALPQSPTDVENYLQKSGLSVAHLLPYEQLRSAGVRSTPTLIILSSSGVVEGVWVGMLNDARRREVLAKLGALTRS
jgi:hypothetical protein